MLSPPGSSRRGRPVSVRTTAARSNASFQAWVAQPGGELLALHPAHRLERGFLLGGHAAVQVFPSVEPDVGEREAGYGLGRVDDAREHAADVVGVHMGDHEEIERALVLGERADAVGECPAGARGSHVDDELVAVAPAHPDRVALAGVQELDLHVRPRPRWSTRWIPSPRLRSTPRAVRAVPCARRCVPHPAIGAAAQSQREPVGIEGPTFRGVEEQVEAAIALRRVVVALQQCRAQDPPVAEASRSRGSDSPPSPVSRCRRPNRCSVSPPRAAATGSEYFHSRALAAVSSSSLPIATPFS